MIFCKKICAAASAFFGDTPVSPSLLVKHASSRVRTLLHAIYKRKKATKMVALCVCGRGDEIRTRDILVPNQALYQAELHPVDQSHIYTIFFILQVFFLLMCNIALFIFYSFFFFGFMYPAARKLKVPSLPIIKWSKTSISIISASSTKFFVISTSAFDGSIFPEG